MCQLGLPQCPGYLVCCQILPESGARPVSPDSCKQPVTHGERRRMGKWLPLEQWLRWMGNLVVSHVVGRKLWGNPKGVSFLVMCV